MAPLSLAPPDILTPSSGPVPTPGDDAPGWRDRLVDLLVLAENGDDDASAALVAWYADDPVARRTGDDIQGRCRLVREA